MLGVISGVIGVLLGVLFSGFVGGIGDLPVAITAPSLAVGFAFGVGTTLFAGIYPANRAAKLDPIKEMRTE